MVRERHECSLFPRLFDALSDAINQMYKTELHTHIFCVVNKSKFIIMNANNNLSINTTQAAN